ncbi:hypothetical protein BGX20_005736, partial [Mortierella sp. AD010]
DGFIAGVTNQLFEDRTSWWDVLCNIDTGKITVSKDITPLQATSPFISGYYEEREKPIVIMVSPTPSRYENGDNEFMAEILSAIQAHYGEMAIRAKFQEYVARFVQLASQYEEQTFGRTTIGLNLSNTPESAKYLGTGLVFTDEVSRSREILGNSMRIEGWRATTSYTYLQEDHQTWLSSRSIKCMDVKRVISLLKMSRTLSNQEASSLYRGFFLNITTNEQIIEFLSCLPLSQGGLFCVAYGLFHPAPSVRCDTVAFFNRLNQHPTGQVYIKSLNRFERNTYERLAREYALQEEDAIRQQHEFVKVSESMTSLDIALT